jgi:hypothetical protein
MGREGVSAETARRLVMKDDEERRNWALSLYGMDTSDSSLYDMLLHIGSLTVDDAARIIAEAVQHPSFQMTPESKRLLNDRVLASQVEALLLEEFPRVQVTARDGEAFVQIRTGLSIHTRLTEKQKIMEKVESIAISLGGAEKAHVTFGLSA